MPFVELVFEYINASFKTEKHISAKTWKPNLKLG